MTRFVFAHRLCGRCRCNLEIERRCCLSLTGTASVGCQTVHGSREMLMQLTVIRPVDLLEGHEDVSVLHGLPGLALAVAK